MRKLPEFFSPVKPHGCFLTLLPSVFVLFSADHLDQVAHFPQLDQVAHLYFAPTAPYLLLTVSLTHWKFYGTSVVVLHQQRNCFQLF